MINSVGDHWHCVPPPHASYQESRTLVLQLNSAAPLGDGSRFYSASAKNHKPW